MDLFETKTASDPTYPPLQPQPRPLLHSLQNPYLVVLFTVNSILRSWV